MLQKSKDLFFELPQALIQIKFVLVFAEKYNICMHPMFLFVVCVGNVS